MTLQPNPCRSQAGMWTRGTEMLRHRPGTN